jgi:hypothetical protein
MTVAALSWAFDVPVKTPSHRAVLLFLANDAMGEQVTVHWQELCERVPIQSDELTGVLLDLRASGHIDIPLPIVAGTLRFHLNCDGL